MNKLICVKFAIFCAEQTQCEGVVAAAKDWLTDPSFYNRKLLIRAGFDVSNTVSIIKDRTSHALITTAVCAVTTIAAVAADTSMFIIINAVKAMAKAAKRAGVNPVILTNKLKELLDEHS